jgi:outer membrane protein TolC
MHADLAVDYFQARSLDAEEQLLNSTVTQYERALELTRSRYDGGIASEVEVEQARTILQTTRAEAIDVGVSRAQFEHAVAILIGKPPAEFSLPPLPLIAPPPRIPVGVPSDLLERRPDIAAEKGWLRPPMLRSELRSRLTTRSSIWVPREDLKALPSRR